MKAKTASVPVNARSAATLFLASAFACCIPARADDELRRLLSLSLEEQMTMTVSIAAQVRQPIAKAPAVVSLITTEDLRATGATNLMEVLQSVPGVYVRTSLFGARPLITMRGASGVNVLLMINGSPVKDLVWSPGIFWKGVPADMIERIEIIRGPGSALYGADASAGVINVITKTAETIRTAEAGLRAGSFDTLAGWLHYGREWQGYDIAFTADLSRTAGHNPWIARDHLGRAGTAHYGYDNHDLHFSLSRDRWRLLADVTHHDNVAIGLTGAAILDPLTRAHDRTASLAVLYHNDAFATDWGLSGEVRWRDVEYGSGNGFWENPPGPGEKLNQLNSAERRVNAEILGHYRGWRNHHLQIGGGLVWQDLYSVSQFINGVPGSFAPEKMRRNGYAFAQDIWNFAERWEMTVGARYDRYSDFGSSFNPRLALVWQATPQLTAKLMYGKAFRAPSFMELYAQTAANASNPALRPERSKTWELSVAYRACRDLSLGANIYRFVRNDVIAPDTVAPYRFENRGRYAASGIELEGRWQAGDRLRLAGNLSRMWNGSLDQPLRDLAIPLRQAYLRADWAFLPKWNWNVQAHWFDRRPLLAGDPRTVLGSVLLLDTTLRYLHGSDWEFAASIRNLTNRERFEYSSRALAGNLPLPGRNFHAEVRYKF